MVAGALTRYALFSCVCDLKAAVQMNVQRNLIQKLILYEFELCKQKHLLYRSWRSSWSEYSNQVFEEI